MYFQFGYSTLHNRVSAIEIVLDKKEPAVVKPIVYPFLGSESKVNFDRVYKFEWINDSIARTDGLEHIALRKFRIYFVSPADDYPIKWVTLLDKSGHVLKNVKESELELSEGIRKKSATRYEINKKYAYIEYTTNILYKTPVWKLLGIILLLTVSFSLFFSKSGFLEKIKDLKNQEYIAFGFLISIFLFHPLFNVMLIVSLIFYLRKFDILEFWNNKINVLFTALFLCYLLSTIFSAQNGLKDFSTVERLLPFVLLPALFSSVHLKNSVHFIAASGFLVGMVLFFLASIDTLLIGNIEFFSFDNFSKYYHPVYFSYILFFTICFVEEQMDSKSKYYIQFALFGLLLFLGSKMVLLTALFLYLLFYLNLKKNWKKAILLVAGFTVLFSLFKPVQNRFKEIIDFDDLSVLKEKKLESNDERINGLTMRIILWREAIGTLESWPEFIFGKGAAKSNETALRNRLNDLGLTEHLNYNPHNQYVDTYIRTGLVGLFILLAILGYAIYQGMRINRKLLLVYGLFMFSCMFSEVVFGRVRGVYFFTVVLIILTNTKPYAENSNIGN